MATTASEARSVGARFRESEAVTRSVRAIGEELRARQAEITGARGPRSDAAKVEFEELMRRAGETRGRDLLYPYLGSGLGNGALVELADGSVKWDMICGIGVHFFGHSDPDLVETQLLAATGDTAMQGHLMCNPEAYDLAGTLLDEAKKGSKLAHCFLCNSGAMANENALKVCMQARGGAARVLAFAHCFMGRTVTMAQIGDSAAGRQGIPLSTLVDYMPFYDHVRARMMSAGDVSGSTRFIDMAVMHLEDYIRRYPGQHSCFVFELVQGEGGFNTALPDFHRALMEVCRANGIPVWDDEVQTFGRTTEMYCYDALGLGDMVDIVTVGKMSQVCAALYTSALNPKPGLLSATFLGSTMSLAVGRRMLERLREGGHYGHGGKHARHYELFTERVKGLAARHPQWFPHDETKFHDIVGGFGGMMRFTPFNGEKEPVTKLCRALYDEGVIAFYCGHDPYHVRMLPPLGVMEESQWGPVFEIVERAMAKVAPGANA